MHLSLTGSVIAPQKLTTGLEENDAEEPEILKSRLHAGIANSFCFCLDLLIDVLNTYILLGSLSLIGLQLSSLKKVNF